MRNGSKIFISTLFFLKHFKIIDILLVLKSLRQQIVFWKTCTLQKKNLIYILKTIHIYWTDFLWLLFIERMFNNELTVDFFIQYYSVYSYLYITENYYFIYCILISTNELWNLHFVNFESIKKCWTQNLAFGNFYILPLPL